MSSSSHSSSRLTDLRQQWLRLPAGARWRLAILCLIALAFLLLTGRGQLYLLARDPHWERIQQKGLLRVGMDASYPPFEWIEDQAYHGLDVELAQEIGQRWNMDVVFVNTHFDGLYDAMLAGRCDLIISALPYDEMMTQDLLYSQSYFNAGQVALVQIDSGPGQIDDVRGQAVAVELGAESHQLALQLTRDQGWGLTIHAFRDIDQAVEAMLRGETQGLFCDRVDAYAIQASHPKVGILTPPLTEAPFVIATPIDALVLRDQVNMVLMALEQEGELARMTSDWLSQSQRPSP